MRLPTQQSCGRSDQRACSNTRRTEFAADTRGPEIRPSPNVETMIFWASRHALIRRSVPGGRPASPRKGQVSSRVEGRPFAAADLPNRSNPRNIGLQPTLVQLSVVKIQLRARSQPCRGLSKIIGLQQLRPTKMCNSAESQLRSGFFLNQRNAPSSTGTREFVGSDQVIHGRGGDQTKIPGNSYRYRIDLPALPPQMRYLPPAKSHFRPTARDLNESRLFGQRLARTARLGAKGPDTEEEGRPSPESMSKLAKSTEL